jgi:hypothetical protein
MKQTPQSVSVANACVTLTENLKYSAYIYSPRQDRGGENISNLKKFFKERNIEYEHFRKHPPAPPPTTLCHFIKMNLKKL